MREHLTHDSQTGERDVRAERFKQYAFSYVKRAIENLYRVQRDQLVPDLIPVSVIQHYLDKCTSQKFEGRTIGLALKELGYERHQTRLTFTGDEKNQTPVYIHKNQNHLLEIPMKDIRTQLFTDRSLKILKDKTHDYYDTHFKPQRINDDENVRSG